MNTRETTELEDFIFDLHVAEEQQDEVKGGRQDTTGTISLSGSAAGTYWAH